MVKTEGGPKCSPPSPTDESKGRTPGVFRDKAGYNGYQNLYTKKAYTKAAISSSRYARNNYSQETSPTTEEQFRSRALSGPGDLDTETKKPIATTELPHNHAPRGSKEERGDTGESGGNRR